jgi:hypothetical protein
MDEDESISSEMNGLALDGMDAKEIWSTMHSPEYRSSPDPQGILNAALVGVIIKLECRIKVLESEAGIDPRSIFGDAPKE